MSTIQTDYTFPSSATGNTIAARAVRPARTTLPAPVVVLLTGDGPKGTKSASWTNLPPLLAEAGIASFLFDFEGLGYSGGQRRALTLTRGIDNFKTSLDFLRRQPWSDPTRFGALASSFGASVLLSQPELANSFRAIGLKSPAAFLPDAYVAEVGIENLDVWAHKGFLEENGYGFDVLLDPLGYNLYAAARGIRAPSLITHGDADAIVPFVQSKYLMECLGGPKQLEVFRGGSHGYSEEGAWDRMASLFVDWFKTHLRGGS